MTHYWLIKLWGIIEDGVSFQVDYAGMVVDIKNLSDAKNKIDKKAS